MFSCFRVLVINNKKILISNNSLNQIRKIVISCNRKNEMNQCLKTEFSNKDSFLEAIEALNLLQTNASVIRQSVAEPENSGLRNLQKTEKYLLRSGISVSQLDKIPIIHVSGTKGKGSTCSLTESILRSFGLKTGLFTSPHLISVTERIQLDGQSITKNNFARHFWKIFNVLDKAKENKYDMPAYFKFLTIMSFHVFLEEKVDVAIIEVGIGGEYDCTNIIRNTQTVGITNLGLEHTNVLGTTLREIAWQKAGIIKLGSNVFTVKQPTECLSVIRSRSEKKNAKVLIVPNFDLYNWCGTPKFGLNNTVQKINASLAIQLAYNWLKINKNQLPTKVFKKINFLNENEELCLNISEEVINGLESWFWPGRCQLVEHETNSFYLDGAHTNESMEICIEWFENSIKKTKRPRCLIFNTTGERDFEKMLKIIHDKVFFDLAVFVPNISSCKSNTKDHSNYLVQKADQIKRCTEHEKSWMNLGLMDNSNDRTMVMPCVTEVIRYLNVNSNENGYDVLVTGSLHLIGATLLAIENLNDKNANR